MNLTVNLSGSYKVTERILGLFNYSKTGSFSIEHDFPVPSYSFSRQLPIPGPLHIIASLEGVNVTLTASIEGIVRVYSHTFNLEKELAALTKNAVPGSGNKYSFKFPDFSELGVALTGTTFTVSIS